jgi:hypothetical protein
VPVVGFAAGCDILVGCNSSSGIAAAVALAKTAVCVRVCRAPPCRRITCARPPQDVAIVFVGLHPGQGGGDAREDEGWDRTCVRPHCCC